MLKIFLTGVSGAMGKVLQEVIKEDPDCEVVAGFDLVPNDTLSFPVYNSLDTNCEKADVIIDFSHFLGADAILGYALETKTPLVMATTGLSQRQLDELKEASKIIPVFKTANMSLGINLLAKALRELSKDLEGGFDIEIIEKHHNKKLDSPSGTALLLADAINEGLENPKDYTFGRSGREAKREKSELGIHAIRGGTIPGEHSVLFAGNDEILEFKHTALSKKVFANGAVVAAKYLVSKKPGYYNMEDVIA